MPVANLQRLAQQGSDAIGRPRIAANRPDGPELRPDSLHLGPARRENHPMTAPKVNKVPLWYTKAANLVVKTKQMIA